MQMKKKLVMLACLMAPMLTAGELEDVLKKHWDAIGGLKAHEAIKTVTIQGTLSVGTPQGSMDLGISMKSKDRDKARMDMTFQGTPIIQCLNGESGWKVNPLMGSPNPEDLTEAEIKTMQKQADFMGDFHEPEKKGITLALKGKADVEGTETFHITATNEEGEVTDYYIDTENYVLIKESGKQTQNGMEVETDTYYSDYKEVGGIIMAHSLQIKSSNPAMGGGAEMRFEKVEINKEIPDSEFEKPAQP